MTQDTQDLQDPLRDTVRHGAPDASSASWRLLALGGPSIWFGMFMLSYKAGSVVALVAFGGVAFLLGGTTQLLLASRVPAIRWVSILGGILGIAARGAGAASGRRSPWVLGRPPSPHAGPGTGEQQ